MEIGQSPLSSNYSQPAPVQPERNESPRQERLESNEPRETTPAPQPATNATSGGPVGGNIDTYA
ncbi:hypothetical protein [Alteromonas lipolytica]|uniref:Uncharacterized protein n=1 Tax=Alteromonas lipolytica TaxID=1856405 RepID=A0A1E8FEL9_9ALTE|nr:hypothetical protein [Alteromonas lipolytica]OFI34359.1 hypothetical protein BFC17_18415 [Alteromonas lipolytica]GGF82148.1 hypothetical protein GCM10011338_38020 [Alteromonas lipolytica]